MTTPKFTRKHFWVSVLVQLQLLAMLCPASAKSMSGETGSCTGASVQSATVAAVSVPAADQQVAIPKETVDLATQQANWKLRYTDAEKLHQVFLEYIVFSSEKRLDVAKVWEAFDKNFEKAIPPVNLNNQNLYPYDDLLHTMFDVALKMPEIAPSVPTIWQKITEVNNPNSFESQWFGNSVSQISASAKRYSLAVHIVENAAETFAQAHNCAQEDPAFAQAFDKLFGDTLNASILDDAKTVLEKNPELPVPAEIRGRIGEDGTITISIDELKGLAGEEFDKLHGTIDDIQETLIEIDKQQDVIVDYIKDQELKAKWQEAMKKKAAAEQLNLDASKASITIISTLLNQLDPKLGKTLSVVATSTLQVGEALNKWLTAISGLNGLDKLTSMSTVVMTGNVLGAVMNVIALFSPAQPTPEQLILEEIGKLRQQVDQLRSEMHSRFDRIDRELNTIYSTMQQRFDQVDLQLGKINGKLEEVQQALIEIDLKLSRIEYNNFEMLSALGRRPLLEAINGGLNYLETTGQPMPYEPNFVQFANTLYTWGALHAFDALEAGPSQTDYSDANVLAVLNAYGTDTNINYLNGWLSVHGLPTIADKRIASPRDWLLASRAFTQLGIEWPEHMGRYDAQRQVELDRVGADIQAAMLNISTVDTPEGPQGNHLLYTGVISNYQSKVDLLASSIISKVETPLLKLLVSERLHQSQPFDLFGGVEQQLSYQSPNIDLIGCGQLATLPAPNNLKALLPDFNRYNLAEYLSLGSFSTCGDAVLRNPHQICLPKQEVCHYEGNLKIELVVHFEGVGLATQSLNLGGVVLAPEDGEDPTDYVFAHWEAIKLELEQDNTPDSPSPQEEVQIAALRTKTTTDIHNRLVTFQQELYGLVKDEMSQGLLRPLAVELAGSKALLTTFVILGLPRAVAEDEFLRAMLFGDQQLVEEGQILQTYTISSTQPITEVNLLVNARQVITQTAGERVDAFSGILNQYLDAISARNHAELPDYIANTRGTLDLTMRIAHLELSATPTPSVTPVSSPTPKPSGTPVPSGTPAAGTEKIHLPLVNR